MGRIGYFVTADNAGADGDRAGGPGPARPRADVLLARQPGDLLRRRAGLHRHRAATRWPGRRCSPARSPTTSTTTCWAPTAPMRRTTSTPPPALHQDPASSPRWPRSIRRCATARTSTATPRDEAGIYAFSRLHRSQQREYVVVLNNSESAKTAAIPTYVANGALHQDLRRPGRRPRSRTATAGSRSPCRPCRPWSTSRCGRSRGSTAAPQITLNAAAADGGDQLPDAGVGERQRLRVQRGDLLRQVRPRWLEEHRHRRHAALPGVPRRQLARRRRPRWPTAPWCGTTPVTSG